MTKLDKVLVLIDANTDLLPTLN